MQKKRRRSFRKKIKLPLHKTPAQRFRMELRRREKTRAKSREKIARIKMQYKTKAVKQKGRQKESRKNRPDAVGGGFSFRSRDHGYGWASGKQTAVSEKGSGRSRFMQNGKYSTKIK